MSFSFQSCNLRDIYKQERLQHSHNIAAPKAWTLGHCRGNV